jgi:EAL domain-containing protein (putative c-di-GMP-specific phosphodiesterase class I)
VSTVGSIEAVRAMVEVARGLEMKTIAEYVGDDESVQLLRNFGVDYARGFHIGKPAPITTLASEHAG